MASDARNSSAICGNPVLSQLCRVHDHVGSEYVEIQHYVDNQATPLYNTCIQLPIFLYGAETWSVTATLSKKIDALDGALDAS